MPLTERGDAAWRPVLELRVVGPDAAVPTRADLRRLFEHRALSRDRRERMRAVAKLLVVDRGRLVGFAAYERAADGLRVYELAVASHDADVRTSVLHCLLRALETACLAGGCRRLLLMPAAVAAAGSLELEGFHFAGESCRDCWLERRVG